MGHLPTIRSKEVHISAEFVGDIRGKIIVWHYKASSIGSYCFKKLKRGSSTIHLLHLPTKNICVSSSIIISHFSHISSLIYRRGVLSYLIKWIDTHTQEVRTLDCSLHTSLTPASFFQTPLRRSHFQTIAIYILKTMANKIFQFIKSNGTKNYKIW